MAYAQQTFDQLVNSPQRELKVFTEREGGVHHVSLDNMANAGVFIADSLAEALGGQVSRVRRPRAQGTEGRRSPQPYPGGEGVTSVLRIEQFDATVELRGAAGRDL